MRAREPLMGLGRFRECFGIVRGRVHTRTHVHARARRHKPFRLYFATWEDKHVQRHLSTHPPTHTYPHAHTRTPGTGTHAQIYTTCARSRTPTALARALLLKRASGRTRALAHTHTRTHTGTHTHTHTLDSLSTQAEQGFHTHTQPPAMLGASDPKQHTQGAKGNHSEKPKEQSEKKKGKVMRGSQGLAVGKAAKEVGGLPACSWPPEPSAPRGGRPLPSWDAPWGLAWTARGW